MANHVSHNRDYKRLKPLLFRVFGSEIERWLSAMETYDPDGTKHTLRTTALSVKMAQGLGFSKEDLFYIQYGTLLHDIGKLSIPKEIIHKPGKLTVYEYQAVKQHPVYAQEWLQEHKNLEHAIVVPLYHHEWWDGSGYPYGLQGEAIPIMARLVAVVDVWDALTSDRPYRRAMTPEAALAIIRSESGTHFDPQMVEAFFKQGIYLAEVPSQASPS